MGKMQKNKGANFELKISKLFTKWSQESGMGTFYRTPASGAWASQRTGQDAQSGDIVAPQEMNFPLSLELKHHEGVTVQQFLHSTGEVPKFFTQAVGDAVRSGKVPALIAHWNYNPNYLVLPYSYSILEDAKAKHLDYLATTIKYKDALSDEELYLDVLMLTLEDFMALYTIKELLEGHVDMFSGWYDKVAKGLNSRRTGSKNPQRSTNVDEILDNL